MDTFKRYSATFTSKALDAGFSQNEIDKCLKYSKPLFKMGLPVIYNASHLSVLVGYNSTYLRRVVRKNSTKWFYREFKIKKENGDFRNIKEPLPSLKEIQKWILYNILNKVSISPYAKAYTKKKNIRDHARYHRGQRVVLTMDIERFFDRISRSRIEQIFKDLNYSEKVSELLSKLCTLENSLPQGAPTSPYLSNILMSDFDQTIAKYCNANGLKYTRYADDLAFSSDKINTEELNQIINKELEKVGLNLNQNKTFLMPVGKRQQISGIVVNEKLQVPREKRDELRQAVYFIDKYGLENHLEWIKCQKGNYIKHLLGIANYILFINPKDERTRKMKEFLKNEL